MPGKLGIAGRSLTLHQASPIKIQDEVRMHQRITGFLIVTACLVLLSACVTTQAAPGADKVKVTNIAADVAGCTAVGNIHVPRTDGVVDVRNAGTQFRNAVVGLGGNAGFVTDGGLNFPADGIAYRCP